MIEDIAKVSKERVKSIRELTSKTFGKDALVDFSGKELTAVPSFSTGSLALDKTLGKCGGWPIARMIEIAGAPSTGKSTLAIHAMVEMQKTGRLVGLCEPEASFDPYYAKNLGLDLESLFLNQPMSAEEGLSIVESWIKTGDFGLIVVDSADSLLPMSISEADYGTSTMALTARLISTANRRLTPLCKKYSTTFMWLNQYRSSLNPYGPNEVSSGGKSIPYYASVRVKLKNKEKVVTGSNDPTGNMVEAQIIKSKVSAPHRSAMLTIEYGKGVVRAGELVDLGVDFGFISKGGAWYTINGERIQGRAKAVEYLQENAPFAEDLEKRIKQSMVESV